MEPFAAATKPAIALAAERSSGRATSDAFLAAVRSFA